jgi:hypothetical protein
VWGGVVLFFIVLFYLLKDLAMQQGCPDFTTQPSLALNSKSSCLSFPSAQISGMYHHAQLQCVLL